MNEKETEEIEREMVVPGETIISGEDYLENGIIELVKFEKKIGDNNYEEVNVLDYSSSDSFYITITKSSSKYKLDKFNVEIEIIDLKNNVIFSKEYTDKLGMFSDYIFRIELPKTIFNSVRSGDIVAYRVKVLKDNIYDSESGKIGVEK